MTINFYNITKRLNSTAAVPATPAATLDCYLKNDCSFLTPYLRVNSSTKPSYNYFKLEDRYYWVTEVTSIANELWEIRGSVDPLTTFRNHIFNTQAFVLYDSTPNTQLPDNRLGVETDCTAYTSTEDMPWSFSSGAGTYLIATTGNGAEMDLINLIDHPGERVGTGVYTIPQNQLNKLGFDISDWVTNFNTIWTNFNTFTTINAALVDYFCFSIS